MQDNKRFISLHEDYPHSVGKVSKHARIRCFFVVHKIDKGEMNIVCCPVEHMLVDFRSKLTQGSLVVRQINTLQGIDEKYFLMHETWCILVMERYYLWDELEDDLVDL